MEAAVAQEIKRVMCLSDSQWFDSSSSSLCAEVFLDKILNPNFLCKWMEMPCRVWSQFWEIISYFTKLAMHVQYKLHS